MTFSGSSLYSSIGYLKNIGFKLIKQHPIINLFYKNLLNDYRDQPLES
jgi:hypothetical protein